MFIFPIGVYLGAVKKDDFQIKINTALGTGTSYTLPLPTGQVYDFWWTPYIGAAPRHVTAYNDVNATYDYGVNGVYAVSVGVNDGDKCGGWKCSTTADAVKITEVTQWGNVGFESLTGAFGGCVNITSIDVSTIDLSIVSRVDGFLNGCTSLTALNVSDWDISNLIGTGLIAFANGCTSLVTLDVSNWDMSNITSLQSFVDGCGNLTALDVSSWDVSNVTSLVAPFRDCSSLIVLYTSSWDTSSVTSCIYMAPGCTSLTSSFDENKWWSRTPAIANHVHCFTGDTGIPEYPSIPNDWKGL